MPITASQRLARRRAIGSSDAAAILGVDPKRSALEVYLSKVADLEEDETSEPVALGNRFEEAILDHAADRLSLRIEKNVGPIVCPEASCLAANLDAVVVAPSHLERAMEAKFTGLGHLFGEPGTDQLPERVLVQTSFQMGCLPTLELIYVPVLLARWGRPRVEIYEAPRVNDLVDLILERCEEFWRLHVEPQIPPNPTPGLGEAALSVLKRVRRQPAAVAEIPAELALAYREASEAAKEAEDAKARAQAALLAAGGDAEGFDFGDPKKYYTYLQYEKKGVDTKALFRDHPHLKDLYSRTSKYRAMFLVNK